jgi:hypothetical protein
MSTSVVAAAGAVARSRNLALIAMLLPLCLGFVAAMLTFTIHKGRPARHKMDPVATSC